MATRDMDELIDKATVELDNAYRELEEAKHEVERRETELDNLYAVRRIGLVQ